MVVFLLNNSALLGIFQLTIYAAVFIAVLLAIGIYLPYNWGRVIRKITYVLIFIEIILMKAVLMPYDIEWVRYSSRWFQLILYTILPFIFAMILLDHYEKDVLNSPELGEFIALIITTIIVLYAVTTPIGWASLN